MARLTRVRSSVPGVSSRFLGLGCVLLMVAVAGCSSDDPQAEPSSSGPRKPTTAPNTAVSTPSPTYPSRPRPSPQSTEGPEAAWTLDADGDEDLAAEVVAVGNLLVLRTPELVRAVRRADGRDVWRHESGAKARFQSILPTAGGLAVTAGSGGGQVSAEVLDPATGKPRWRSSPAVHLAVYRDAVYLDDCRTDQDPCTVTARATTTGRVLWRTPSGHALTIESRTIGSRSGVAPGAGRYLAARLWSAELGRPQYAALETATGRLQTGRLPASEWYGVVDGELLVATDHGRTGSTDCAVRISTVDVTGGRARSTSVQSPTLTTGACRQYLADTRYGQTLLGSGGRFAAVQGRLPVLYDVQSGELDWTGTDPGVPVDADAESVLVRDTLQKGGLALLDAGSGRRRWTADDPGLDILATSWHTRMTGRLVVLNASSGGRTQVVAYDEESGRMLGRYNGELAGAGGDWVAISSPGSLALVVF